jgi:4-amino-4-deoxy-L-arabinose transferase-like glycosyltransferase
VATQPEARQRLQHIAAAGKSLPAGVAALAGVWLLAHAALALPLATALHGTATWIIVLLPGALLAWLLSGGTREPLLLLFLGLCGGIALAALLMLVLHILPGTPPWWALLLVCDVLTLWHGWLLRRATPTDITHAPEPTPRRAQWALLMILLLAAGLRLPFLGSAEFQGDEARAMLIAMKVQQGQDDILLFHRKGPVEVLLPAAPLVLTGTVDEWGARLPFALAGIGTVLGSYLLARHLFGTNQGTYIGLLAALLVASEGFLLAFSRIVQYQSVLIFLGAGALLCGWRFYTGAAHPQRWLLGAAALAAVGLLAHYDGVYVLPPLAFLTLAGGGQYWQTRGAWLRGLAPSVLLGAVLLISFYLPFFTHDQFGGTIAYLTERVNAEHVRRLLFNNLPGHYEHVTFYNTIPYTIALVVVLAGAVAAWLVRYLRGAGWLLAVLWLAGSALLVVAPHWFILGERLNWAILALGVPLAALAAAPATPAALRVLLLWFAVPFAAHAFIIADPRTHFYTMNTAAALLVALALIQLAGWRRRGVQVPLAAAGALLLLIQVPYLHLAFLQQVPEFQRSFPLARPAIYRDLASDRVPWEGIFGFPHRDGWKVAGELYTRGMLEGTYHSNQRDRTSIWYTRGAARCAPDPDYFLLATWDGADLSENLLVEERAADYTLAACVLVDGMRMMNIHTQEPLPTLAGREVLDLDTYATAFDAHPVPDFPIQQALNVVVPQYELNAVWQDGFRLTGYDLKERRVAAGQRANLTLYWQLDNIPTSSYRGTIEVRDANGILVSHAEPICHSPETDSWGRYVTNSTMFALNTEDALEPGTYTLHARLLHADTNAPLALTDGTTGVQLGSFIVEEP